MNWSRRWIIDSPGKLADVLRELRPVRVDQPLELILRTERVDKTAGQRALFHAVCGEIAARMSMTPAQVKLRIKAAFYGVDVKNDDGIYYALVPSSEDSDREEYSRLIDHAYAWAAEGGHFIPDRRPK